MFSNQLKAINKVGDYLSSREKEGIAAFQKLSENIIHEKPKCVVFMMMHEHLEAYVRFGNEFKLHREFFEVLSNDEIESLNRYKYNEDKVHEDFIYWEIARICKEFVEMWLCQCYAESNISEQLDIPFYFMSEPDSEEIFHLNECKKIMNKKAYQEHFEMVMRVNSMESPLEIN